MAGNDGLWAVAIIDGTGPGSWDDYYRMMHHSFCRQIYEQMVGYGDAQYEQGPSWSGIETNDEMGKAGEYLHKLVKEGGIKEDRIVLVGYSRGAAAAVEAARYLERRNMTVRAAFLFDPVAWYPFANCEMVPDNIQNVFIARRSLDGAMGKKYPDQMRGMYGTTATHYNLHYKGQLRINDAHFPATHGGMGGVGWSNVPEDVTGQALVAGYMNYHFKSIGMNVALASYPPTA